MRSACSSLASRSTVGHLSDERDQAKAEAARAQAALDRERIDVGRGAQPPALLGHSGALFSLPSSPSLTEGAIGVVITNAIAGRNYTWIVVDGRGAVPGDGYFLEGGLCDSGSAVPFGGGPGSLAGGASNTDGDLRLVAGPLSSPSTTPTCGLSSVTTAKTSAAYVDR